MNETETVTDPVEAEPEAEPKTETTSEPAEETSEDIVTVTDGDADIRIQYIEPPETTKYEQLAYTIDIVHSITLGEIVLATLLAMLIVVIFLSRVIGGGAR